jgi:hypothetical protein
MAIHSFAINYLMNAYVVKRTRTRFGEKTGYCVLLLAIPSKTWK